MQSELLKDIQSILSDPRRGRLLLPRGDAERTFLEQWLQGEPAATPSAEQLPLDEMIAGCRACDNAGEKRSGFGTGQNRVMLLLNAPSMLSPAEKKHLKGDSIELLKKMVSAMGLVFSECYTTNLIKCEPAGTFVKPSEMLGNCRSILEKEIAFYRPQIVLVMGDILPIQKIVHESVHISWFKTEHPVTLIKNPDLKRGAWNTLKAVMEKLKG